jgi:hypothetical protein
VITHKSGWSLRGASFATKQSHSVHEIASQKALAMTLPAMWVITSKSRLTPNPYDYIFPLAELPPAEPVERKGSHDTVE